MEEGLAAVMEKITKERGNPGKMLKNLLRDFNYSLGNYAKVTKGAGTAGKSKLDKERHKWILREMVRDGWAMALCFHFRCVAHIAQVDISPSFLKPLPPLVGKWNDR